MLYQVTVPTDNLPKMSKWALANCPSYQSWTFNKGTAIVSTHVTRYLDITYYFGDERDAILFALKWS